MPKYVNEYSRDGTIILTLPLFIATNGIRSIFNSIEFLFAFTEFLHLLWCFSASYFIFLISSYVKTLALIYNKNIYVNIYNLLYINIYN